MSEMIPNLSFLIGAKLAADKKAASRDANHLACYGDNAWKINNSSWDAYSAGVSFPGLGQTLDEVVTRLQTESAVGLDLAGGTDGTAMLDLIECGILSQAAVTNYQAAKSADPRADWRLTHLTGNLLVPATWAKILSWQQQAAPTGLRLMTHEPGNTLQWFKPDVYKQAGALSLSMIEGGGVFVAQQPEALSATACSAICTSLAARPDVQDVFVSEKHRDKRQVLIIKA